MVAAAHPGNGEIPGITRHLRAGEGRAGGGIINAVMRSGTNQFHASAWEFLRNTDLNAVGFFKPATGKPALHRNQFGTAISGPFIKNKLFFFGDYEGYRQTQGYVNFYSVPSTSDRQGILPVPVVNPLTGTVYPANTAISVTQINPFAAAALAGLPAPANTTRANNLLATIPLRDYIDKF